MEIYKIICSTWDKILLGIIPKFSPKTSQRRSPVDVIVKICLNLGKCQSTGVIFGTTVRETISGKAETYTGFSEPPFKSRYGGHLTTFKNKNANHTICSKHIWVLKNRKKLHTQQIVGSQLGARHTTQPMTSAEFVIR